MEQGVPTEGAATMAMPEGVGKGSSGERTEVQSSGRKASNIVTAEPKGV